MNKEELTSYERFRKKKQREGLNEVQKENIKLKDRERKYCLRQVKKRKSKKPMSVQAQMEVIMMK